MRGAARSHLLVRLLAVVLGIVLGCLSGSSGGWSSWCSKLASAAAPSLQAASHGGPPWRSDQTPSEVCEGEDGELEHDCARMASLVPAHLSIATAVSRAPRRAWVSAPAHVCCDQWLARERGPPAA